MLPQSLQLLRLSPGLCSVAGAQQESKRGYLHSRSVHLKEVLTSSQRKGRLSTNQHQAFKVILTEYDQIRQFLKKHLKGDGPSLQMSTDCQENLFWNIMT